MWLGGNTVVCPGVHIGNNVVIGAGSVVTRDIPDWSVAAGNPCRVIRKITEEDRRKLFRNEAVSYTHLVSAWSVIILSFLSLSKNLMHMLAGVHFCFSGYFCACGRSGISFLHNFLSIICARVPGAYLASVYFPDTLYPMGLAAPAGSLLSGVICRCV